MVVGMQLDGRQMLECMRLDIAGGLVEVVWMDLVEFELPL